MINRELIRIKTVQLAYAHITNGGKSMEEALDEMDESLSATDDLYHHMLNLICDITDYAAQRYEMTCTHMAERGAKTLPSDKFVTNKFAVQLQNNKQLERFVDENKKLRWITHEDIVHSVYNDIVGSEEYKAYMESDDNSYEADRDLWRVLYKKFIYQNDKIDEALEDWTLYWNDDRFVIDTFVMKTIKRFEEANGDDQPLLSKNDNPEDRKFGRDLLVYTLAKQDDYRELVKAHIRNWDISRLVTMDLVIMLTAIAEIVNFPGISVNVSLNEYINIARSYCSPKNASFINATLDSIVQDLRQQNKLLK
jgi:transcription antitermination protein NusB